MPRLSRLRFVCVGHVNARFDDLVLDFRDADGRATDSTLWLRNGGGKTSLLNLFFAGVRPSRREFLGIVADTKREMQEYVQDNDRAVVIYEWELDGRPGELDFEGCADRFITGTFYERHGSDLKRLFFSCRVAPDEARLTLEALPLYREENGRRVGRRTLAAFKQEWMVLQSEFPSRQVLFTEIQTEWKDVLDKSGIDPELFRYQMMMNHREGGADELFRFKSHDEFVDFLLEMVLDPSLAEMVRKNIEKHRDDLRTRKLRLVPEEELAQGLSLRLLPLKEIAVERQEYRTEAHLAKSKLAALARFVCARMAESERTALEQAAVQEAQLLQATSAQEQAVSRRRWAAGLRLFAARWRHEAAKSEYELLERRLDEAKKSKRLWEAAIPLRNAKRFERRAEEYRAELAQKRTEHQPLYEDLCQSANQYAAELRSRIGELQAAEMKHREAEVAFRKLVADCNAKMRQNESQCAATRAETRHIEAFLAEERKERRSLLEQGALLTDERGNDGVVRLRLRLQIVIEESTTIESSIRRCNHDKETLFAQVQAASHASAQATERERESEQRLSEALEWRSKLESNRLLRETLEVETVNVEHLTEASLELLRQSVNHTIERIVSLRIARVEDERALHCLETRGLLPPTRDAERLLDVLNPRLKAWSGWLYICENAPDGRATVERLPELALGVIVPDKDFESAKAIAAQCRTELETPVVLAPQSAFENVGHVNYVVIGPHSDAYFDRAAGAEEKLRRESQVVQYAEQLGAAELRRRQLTDLEKDLLTFRSAYSPGWFDQQRQVVENHRNAKELASTHMTQLGEHIQAANVVIRELEEKLPPVRRLIGQMERWIVIVDQYVSKHELRVEEHQSSLKSAEERISELENETRRLQGEADQAEKAAISAASASKDITGEIGRQGLLFEQIEYRTADTLPTSVAIGGLRERYLRLKCQYEEQVGVEGFLQLARENDENALRERQILSRMLNEGLTGPDVDAALSTLRDPDDAEDARQRANDTYTGAFRAAGNSAQAVSRAEERVKEQIKKCRELKASEETSGSELPEDDVQADRGADEHELDAEDLDRQAKKHAANAEAAELIRKTAEQSLDLMSGSNDQVEILTTGYQEILIGIPDPDEEELKAAMPAGDEQARSDLQVIRRQLDAVKHAVLKLDERRQQLADSVRQWAAEQRFEHLQSRLAREFRTISDTNLEERASYLMDQLELRARTIKDKLSEIDKNRDQLVSELHAIASDGLGVLRSAASQSRLPLGIPRIGGTQFLTISMKVADDPVEHRGRLAELVDELVDGQDTPSGLELIQRSVRRIARPIHVRVLNPDPNLDGQRLEIPDMAKFSGGERLTCAVMLYCTLAQLRAQKRGIVRKPSGVLLLDNPIGSASRVVFLNLQRDVARAMGVQLIYTTGVNDYEALHPLPNLIRLRNDRINRVTGQHIVEHDANSTLTIEAARIVRRETPKAPTHAEEKEPAREANVE